jgi:hypothetical protein
MMGNMTVAELLCATAGTPGEIAINWMINQSYGERFKLLERSLDDCYRRLTDARQHNREGVVGEDQLSVQIVNMLQSAGIQAEHDPQVGGHVDILVRGKNGFLWVGEAKIYRGPAYVKGGFLQLSTRYGIAQEGRDRGEIVIYCWQPRAWAALEAWQAHLPQLEFPVKVVEELGDRKLYFRTEHRCPATGITFHVRHIIVPLFFEPLK